MLPVQKEHNLMSILDERADFTWSFHDKWFLEAESGNYVWSDPDYGGTNELIPFDGDYSDWCIAEGIPYGRCKGSHVIGAMVSSDVKILSK